MSFTWSFKGKRSQFYQFGFIINAISKPLEEFLSSCQAFFFLGGGGRGVGRREGPQKLLRHQPYTFTCRTYVMWVCNNHTVLIPMEVKFISRFHSRRCRILFWATCCAHTFSVQSFVRRPSPTKYPTTWINSDTVTSGKGSKLVHL